MALIDDVIGILKSEYIESLKGMTAISTIANIGRYLAGIGGMVYIGKSIVGQVARNESINFIPLIRPIFFLMAVGWSTKICDSIDKICDTISISAAYDAEGMKKAYEAYDNQIEAAIDAKWAKIASSQSEYEKKYGAGSYEEDGSIGRYLTIGISKLKDEFSAALLDTITGILRWINYFAFMVMYLMSFLFRICLRAVAPIAIGIAIFDGFSNNAIDWLGKYINYALLPAIANLYGALSFGILTRMMKAMIDNGIIGNENAGNTNFDITTFGPAFIAVLLVLIIGWFFIPTIANMIVSVGGSSAAVQGFAARAAGVGSAAASGVKTGARVTAMAGGGVAGAFKGASDSFSNKSDSSFNFKSKGSEGGGMSNGIRGAFMGAAQGAANTNVGAKKFKRNMNYKYGSGQYGSR